MERKLSLLGHILAFFFLIKCVSSESVPALLWSNQPVQVPAAESRFNTLVDQIEPDDLLADYVKNKVRVVALVQKDLNVEQFAANDASFVSTIFDDAKSNPVFFANVKTPRNVFNSFKNDDETANDNVVIYLSGKDLKENDDTIKAYTEKYNASGPVVFMLTGESNEFLKVNKRARRDTNDKEASKQPQFFMMNGNNDKPCLLVSVSGAISKLYKKGSNVEEVKSYGEPQLDTTASKCVDDKNANRAEKLTLKIGSLTVSWDFTGTDSSNWEIKPTEVKIDGHNFDVSKNTKVSNFKGFSFSCQKSAIQVSSSEYESGMVIIEGFQVQPYYNKDSPKESPIRFDDSSDCAVWFTLPIFSGLIVILILVAILYFGVIALMSISTPDRFENPKSGRALIITNFDE